MLTLVEFMACWDRLFHRSMTLSQKKWRRISRWQWCLTIFAECPLVLLTEQYGEDSDGGAPRPRKPVPVHIICTRSVIKFSVLGGKYRTDFRYFRYLIVDIRYFPVLRIPTSVSVSVFQNIGYRFGISVYRPKTKMYISIRLSPLPRNGYRR